MFDNADMRYLYFYKNLDDKVSYIKLLLFLIVIVIDEWQY